MSGVVLRCPQCGTTGSKTGECEACHEAQVRFFCTNHAPGRWLESAACGQCGARFGEAARPAGAAPAAGAPMSARRGAPSATSSAGRPPAPRRPVGSDDEDGEAPRRRPTPGAAGGKPRPAPVPRTAPRGPEIDERAVESSTSAPASWRDLLVAVARAHQRRSAAAEASARDRPVHRRGGGCLSRLLLLMVMAFFALVTTFMFGGSLLRMFVPW